MPDGKLHVLTSTQAGQSKQILKTNIAASPKTIVSSPKPVTPQQVASSTKTPVVVRQQIPKTTTIVKTVQKQTATQRVSFYLN